MKLKPKILQIILLDGNPTGIQIAELTTSVVQFISVPRTHLKAFFKRKESDSVATYFLFGKEDEKSKPTVYIGQTEDLVKRLGMHDQEKEFWTRALIFISTKKSFTQAHIRWLEWNSIDRAYDANRYNIDNKNTPSKPFVTEAILAEVEELFETGALLLQSLGFPIFEPLITKTVGMKTEKWYLNSSSGKATATFTDEGIVVHKGSVCSKNITQSFKKYGGDKRRKKMIDDEFIVQTDKGLVFSEDYLFNTPSGAACIIKGRSTNGWTAWKNAQGKTLQDVKRNEVTL